MKFDEWSKVALENNVQDAKKDISNFSTSGYFRFGKWKFGNANIRTIFYVTDGVPILYLYSKKMVASDNKYMKSSSEMFRITDDVIKELNNYLSDEVINAFVKKSSKTEDLFK